MGNLSAGKWQKYLLIVLVILLGLRICNIFLPGSKKIDVGNHKWDKLLVILDEIEKNYVDSINYKDLVEKSLPYIMENLDPHSTYLPPADLEKAEGELVGNFSGIGVQFNVPNDTAVIINVIPGGPSERVGILSGDRIVKVNGENVAGVNFPQDSLIKMLRGQRGTTVQMDIKRGEEIVPFTVRRDVIPVNSVDAAFMVNDTLAYVKLSKFTRTSYKEFVERVIPLRAKGMNSLVFDLRENTGGYFDQALLLANEFLNKGDLIVYMEGKHRPRQDFHADGTGKLKDIALYILIDEGSASSSEIFAGAMQDNDRATILGRRSYGKGLVQEPVYFNDGSGIRLTVARFYSPTGRCIQKPYGEDYRYDIIERYRHGEMMVADSIKINDSLRYETPKGKVVYGGGGIVPDIFVPIDTAGVTKFMIDGNRKSLIVKYSIKLADIYRAQLREIKTVEQLDALLNKMNLEKGYLEYAAANGVVPAPGEWEKSEFVVITQLKGLMGRNTQLDDDAFYPYILKIDNAMYPITGKPIQRN